MTVQESNEHVVKRRKLDVKTSNDIVDPNPSSNFDDIPEVLNAVEGTRCEDDSNADGDVDELGGVYQADGDGDGDGDIVSADDIYSRVCVSCILSFG